MSGSQKTDRRIRRWETARRIWDALYELLPIIKRISVASADPIGFLALADRRWQDAISPLCEIFARVIRRAHAAPSERTINPLIGRRRGRRTGWWFVACSRIARPWPFSIRPLLAHLLKSSCKHYVLIIYNVYGLTSIGDARDTRASDIKSTSACVCASICTYTKPVVPCPWKKKRYTRVCVSWDSVYVTWTDWIRSPIAPFRGKDENNIW